jgi:ribonuclease BN (tRNA processing enzyme)
VKVRVLGCSGAIAKDCKTTSFLLGSTVLIDAGTGVGDLTLDEMLAIDHVFLTHSHLDHIAALPLMLDAVAAKRHTPLTLHAPRATLEALKAHIFNDVIWPDFTRIPKPEAPFLTMEVIETGQDTWAGGLLVEALHANHSVVAVGYAVSQHGPCWVFSGDTEDSPQFWDRVNQLDVGMLVIETAFSNKELDLAKLSLHLAPLTLAQQLSRMRPECDFPIYITHTKPAETDLIMKEIDMLRHQQSSAGRIERDIRWLSAGQEFVL